MPKGLLGVLTALAAGLVLWAGGTCQSSPPAPQGESARVVSVIDGDSVRLRYRGRVESVRLLGIDTPETKHSPRLASRAAKNRRSPSQEARMGEKARSVMLSMIKPGSEVFLTFDQSQGPRDRHGRMLAYLSTAEGLMVNREMVVRGMAQVYRRFKFRYRKQWRELEDQARRDRVGLWSQGGP